jgi:hypothetical protein
MNSKLHIFLTFLNLASVLAALIISIITLSRVLGIGCDEGNCQSMVYITTTFLSSRRIENTIGFPVATERASNDLVQLPVNNLDAKADRNYRFGHFMECMYSARMADKACPQSLSFLDYSNCIANTSIIAGLDTCASFPTVNGQSHWPTSEEYLACVWNNPLLQNSEMRRASQNVFRSCIEKSLWPFFEVPQGIDTPVFMGSYNWALLLVTGLIVMTSFGVYTAGWVEEGKISHGESSYFMRLGMLWSSTALVWNFVFLIVFFLIAFRNTGEFQKGGGLPTTSSTTYLTISVFAVATFYFLSIVWQPVRRRFGAIFYGNGSTLATVVPLSDRHVTCDFERQRLVGLEGTFPLVDKSGTRRDVYELGSDDVARYYTPPLLATWADSFIGEVCIVMGMAGVTGQLSTDRAWFLFFFTLLYRLINMIISRCISDTFMNNIRLDKAVNDAKNSIVTRPMYSFFGNNGYGQMANGSKPVDVHINTKVIGFSAQVANLYLFAGLIYLVFNSNSALNDFGVFKGFFITCFVVPETLRLFVHLYFLVTYDGSTGHGVPWELYNSFFAIWIWDFVFRVIYISVAILETNNNPGTFDFLKTQSNALMRDYVFAMTS